MSDLTQTGALLCTVLGLLSGGLVLTVSRHVLLALKVLLDFLLAAGLLLLSDDPGWRQVATAALVVAVRQLLGSRLRRA